MKRPITYKKISALLLAALLILDAGLPLRADTLPYVGPEIVTLPANTKAPTTEAAPTETEEPTLPEETAEATGNDEPATEANTEEAAESSTEAEPTEPEPQLPEEPELPELTLEQLLSIRQSSGSSRGSVDVYAENTNISGRTAAKAVTAKGNVTSGVLLAKRLKKLAQTSSFNAVIFRGSGYVNIREAADPGSDKVGKMYYNAVATVKGIEYRDDGQWYHLVSGKVDGYAKSEFFVSGAEAMDLITDVLSDWATPLNDGERLYKWADEDSDTLLLLNSDVKYRVMEYDGEWVQLFFGTTEDGTPVTGYVPFDNLDFTVETYTAVTIEDENRVMDEARVAIEEDYWREQSREESRYQEWLEYSAWVEWIEESLAQDERDRAAMEAAIEDNEEYVEEYLPDDTTDLRRDIVANALQYVGILDYVWGGESLIYGVDCSGFMCAIFEQYGIYLVHYSGAQAESGVRVYSLDDARPGDIVSYHDPVSHVGMYIGNGRIVHAPASGRQIEIAEVDFMDIYSIQNVIGD